MTPHKKPLFMSVTISKLIEVFDEMPLSTFVLNEYLSWFCVYRPDMIFGPNGKRTDLPGKTLLTLCLENPDDYFFSFPVDPENNIFGLPIPDWDFNTVLTQNFPRRMD